MRAVYGILSAALALLLFAGCGGDDNGEPPVGTTPSTGGSSGGPEPRLDAPVSRFAPSQEEMPGKFEVNPLETFGLASATWSVTGPFDNAQQGEQLAEQWGYIEGWRVLYSPDGLISGVIEGRYYATIEVHLFETVAGASEAYAQYLDKSVSKAGSEKQDTRALGNESSGWALVEGTVGNTDMVAVFHRFIFRRGNMVAMVITYGGNPFMTIDPARDIAVIIDERALGEREAAEPTPIPTILPGGGN